MTKHHRVRIQWWLIIGGAPGVRLEEKMHSPGSLLSILSINPRTM